MNTPNCFRLTAPLLRSAALVLAFLCTATSITAQAAAGDSSQARTAGTITTEARTLQISADESIEATEGRLLVPENRNREDSRLIEIAFVRLPAKSGVQGPPTVYLSGGPGQSVLGSLSRLGAVNRWLDFLEVGDVLLVDQRGSGRSSPNLGFPWAGETPVNLFRHIEDTHVYFQEIARQASEHFRARGVDLDGYTSEQSADDLNDLRIALGYDKLNLFGFSYGTHLGLATIRRHGDHLENVVLLGVEGPNHTYKLPSTMDVQFNKLALMASEDPAIAAKVPDLNALLDRVLEKLRAEPAVVRLRNPKSDTSLEIPVGADGLLFLLRRDIGDASDLPVFPRLLYSIDQGDYRLLEWFVRKRFRFGTSAMAAIMDAASGATAQRLSRIREEASQSRFGNVMNHPYPEIAEAWAAPDLGDAYRAPIASPVRTLFLSGTLDWNTPPFQAEEVRWGFPNSSHIIVENAGHEQVIWHAKVQQAIVDFLRGESVDDVTASFPTMRFVPLEGYNASNTHPSVPRG